jgi:Tol biopolymer transport system component
MNVFRWLALSAVASLTTACGGDDGDGNFSSGAVTTIAISPSTLTLQLGDSSQLRALAWNAAGQNVVGATIVWEVDDATVATVSNSGLVEAIGIGRTPIRASVGTVHSAITVDVSAAPLPVVTSLRIEPTSAIVIEGEATEFFATARDENGDVITGRGERWTSGDASIAFVEPLGRTTGLRAGSTTVSVQIDGQIATAAIRVDADYPFSLLYSSSLPLVAPTLSTLDISDPAGVPIPVFAPSRPASDPTPSPDGTALAFVVVSGSDTQIYRANRNGSNVLQLTAGAGLRDQPAWSPDGARIAYRERITGLGTDIWTMAANDGSDAQNLTADMGATSQSSPAWSWGPVGGAMRIAFSHSQNGEGHVWTMAADGGDKRQLTTSTVAFDDQPAWSPDNSRIAFQRTASGIFGNIYWVNANVGGNGAALMPALIQLGGPQFAPAWSPDGRLVAFTSRDTDSNYQVFTVWADGTRLAQRTFAAAQHADPAWIVD